MSLMTACRGRVEFEIPDVVLSVVDVGEPLSCFRWCQKTTTTSSVSEDLEVAKKKAAKGTVKKAAKKAAKKKVAKKAAKKGGAKKAAKKKAKVATKTPASK